MTWYITHAIAFGLGCFVTAFIVLLLMLRHADKHREPYL